MKARAAPSGPQRGKPQHGGPQPEGPQHTEACADKRTAVGPLARSPALAQWAMLLGGSVLSTALLRWLAVPAALLLGPMVAGVLMGIQGATVRLPVTSFVAAQSIVGCLIAGVISASIVQTFAQAWPIHLGVVCAIVAISTLTGWTLSRLQVLPGSTAIWGTSPGAASAMMLMAEAFGADAQTVAFMQYLRVLLVAGSASLFARFWAGEAPGAGPAPAGMAGGPASQSWFPPIEGTALAETLLIAGLGAWLGRRLRVPAGAVLVPMVGGAALHAGGLVTIELPPWLLAASYALLGWNIGLGFTRRVLLHAWRALPPIVLSNLVLILCCGGLAWALNRALGIEPLTAYLATSPGGIDSVAIIAASSRVDVSFVMALQSVRLVVVLFAGPPLARLVADRITGRITGLSADRRTD